MNAHHIHNIEAKRSTGRCKSKDELIEIQTYSMWNKRKVSTAACQMDFAESVHFSWVQFRDWADYKLILDFDVQVECDFICVHIFIPGFCIIDYVCRWFFYL